MKTVQHAGNFTAAKPVIVSGEKCWVMLEKTKWYLKTKQKININVRWKTNLQLLVQQVAFWSIAFSSSVVGKFDIL